jgi:hypothetical protein
MGTRFSSDEADLRPLRTDWHHYHLTALDGRYVWRYLVFAMSRSTGPGHLETTIETGDGKGHVLVYRVEGGVRGGQLVLLLTSPGGGVGSESTEVFPQVLTHGYRTHHCGIGLFQTWEGTETVGRVVISRKPLASGTLGAPVPEDEQHLLDALWERDFPAYGALVPPGLTPVATP